MGESESKDILLDEKLLQICSTDDSESESVIIDESSKKESESESVHKVIHKNKEKYAIDEAEHEEPLATDNPVINKPSYLKLFKCGKNILNRLDATCEQACMATSRVRYYTEMFNTITDYNDRSNTPLLNEKII